MQFITEHALQSSIYGQGHMTRMLRRFSSHALTAAKFWPHWVSREDLCGKPYSSQPPALPHMPCATHTCPTLDVSSSLPQKGVSYIFNFGAWAGTQDLVNAKPRALCWILRVFGCFVQCLFSFWLWRQSLTYPRLALSLLYSQGWPEFLFLLPSTSQVLSSYMPQCLTNIR